MITESSTASSVTVQPVQTSTLQEPSPTPEPLVASVNGVGITMAEYQAELALYQAAVDRDLAQEDEELVLNDLIANLLLGQAAVENGFSLDDSVLQERLDLLVGKMGGKSAFDEWLAMSRYDEDKFQKALARSISAAWMRDHIAASVPEVMEQVHAQQILIFDVQEANDLVARLQAGADFAALAFEYDPVARGDLGWFPRGYLLEPEVEEAAFELEPGRISGVIETETGYHIIFIVEHDPERVIDPDARLTLQNAALLVWLESRLDEAEIQILLP
jgi:parvulin-like peptidyl-prolyl isomerase